MIYETIIRRTAIEKGWSGDAKYKAETTDGSIYLLRIAAPDRFDRKKREFEQTQKVSSLAIPMSLPLEFGVCEEGVYTLETFIDGSDAEEYIPHCTAKEQYAFGRDAGRILQKLHTLPAPENIPSWEERFGTKIDRKIAMYTACPLQYERGGDAFLQYLAENRHLLSGRPQTYQHGDYHIGNMMVGKDKKLYIIDFDRDDFGDPWEEFNRIVWCAQKAPFFASGMVDGYFDGSVPEDFWRLLALYICSNTLSSLPWAIPFGETEIQVMRRQADEILLWYDDMRRIIPTWYQKP